MKLGKDVKAMTAGQARQELQRVRQLLRTHRDKDENARCWHADAELYGRALPESTPPGRMDMPLGTLLLNCERYIRRQQCKGEFCNIAHQKKRQK